MRYGIPGRPDLRTATAPRSRRAARTLLPLDAGRPVLPQRLDGPYGTEPPAGAAGALQSQISRPRRRLGPRAAVGAAPAGYRLAVPRDAVDAHRFEQLVEQGRGLLAAGDPVRAGARLREAPALWRGPALPDLPGVTEKAATAIEPRAYPAP
ncbi:AfsR/SARP family transcriptional regulator [Streptomyces mexicanus]|uniref:AfsR/SARP family transcriptional regulator n=1 Tax=Streptomyces mexicanus TaxID=178566 RepID=UPI003673F96D